MAFKVGNVLEGQNRCEIYAINRDKNTITPHKHRHNQAFLSITSVGATGVYEGTKSISNLINLLILSVYSSQDKCDPII